MSLTYVKKIESIVTLDAGTTMEALNQKLAEIEAKKQALQKKLEDIEYEEQQLEQEERWLEQERLKLSRVLTSEEEDTLKKELTAAGELLELVAVICGSLSVVKEEPRSKDVLYEIDIKTAVIFDTGNIGLSAHVTVTTLCPKVEEIVKGLFVQEGTVRNPPPLFWERHWDYGTRISLTSHEALS
jgi:predicted nuclease with TOPRIM domain